jgi:drug/metabolite transporter (DMT)-like permease
MLPSFITAILWSMSVVCANRSARLVGSVAANLSRLCLAGVLLALWANIFGLGLGGGALMWFVLSGVIGFGIGDIAGYEALPRIGSRLTILLAQCLAAPFAALVEWSWLGTTLTPSQIVWAMVILVGVSVAVAPADHPQLDRKHLVPGVLFGVLSAFGQGGGAVISRKAYEVAEAAGQHVDGGTAAYQRIIGGIGFVLAFFIFLQVKNRNGERVRRDWRHAWPWIATHTLTGPVVGVSCYQWALSTTPSGIVLPIVATTPLLVIPFAYLIEHDRPRMRSLIGGAIAVAGAVALTLVH